MGAFGGANRDYSRGTIYWSRTTFSHVNSGAIRSAYAAQGWENGPSATPPATSTPFCGGAAQDFQSGRITWMPAGAPLSPVASRAWTVGI
jgi:hypothetical protein